MVSALVGNVAVTLTVVVPINVDCNEEQVCKVIKLQYVNIRCLRTSRRPGWAQPPGLDRARACAAPHGLRTS